MYTSVAWLDPARIKPEGCNSIQGSVASFYFLSLSTLYCTSDVFSQPASPFKKLISSRICTQSLQIFRPQPGMLIRDYNNYCIRFQAFLSLHAFNFTRI